MPTQHSLTFPATTDIGTGDNYNNYSWIDEAEPVFPATIVMLASLVLSVIGCAILMVA